MFDTVTDGIDSNLHGMRIHHHAHQHTIRVARLLRILGVLRRLHRGLVHLLLETMVTSRRLVASEANIRLLLRTKLQGAFQRHLALGTMMMGRGTIKRVHVLRDWEPLRGLFA